MRLAGAAEPGLVATSDILTSSSAASPEEGWFRVIAEGLSCDKAAGNAGCFELKTLVLVR